MKRTFILILSLLMLISLFSACAEETNKIESDISNTDESDTSIVTSSEITDMSDQYDPTPRDLEYTAHISNETSYGFQRISSLEDYDSESCILVIDSYDICKQVLDLQKNVNEIYSETVTFLKSLDKSYFNSKTILLIDAEVPSSGYSFYVLNVRADADGVTAEYAEILPAGPFVNTEIGYHIIAIEINKSDILGCNSFNAEAETVQYDPTPRDLEYTDKIIPAMFNDDSKHSIVSNETPTPIVIKSFDDIDALLSNVSVNQSEKLVEYLNDLPSDFFTEKIILVNDFTHGIDYTDCGVISVRADENGVTIKYTYKPPSGQISLPADYPCVCVTELNKFDILGCESFNAVVEVIDSNT